MKNEKLLAIFNNGTRDDLKALPRIGTYRANLLLANRPFDSLDAVENVKGITFNMLEMLSDAMPQEMTKFPEVRTEEVKPETDTIEDGEKLFNEIEEEGVDLGEQKPAPQKDPEGGVD